MKHRVALDEEQQKELQGIVWRGKHLARKIRRARSLLPSHQGMSATRTADLLDVHAKSVYRTRHLLVSEGLDAALEEQPRTSRRTGDSLSQTPGQPETHIIPLTNVAVH